MTTGADRERLSCWRDVCCGLPGMRIEYYIYLAILDLKICKEDGVPLDGKRFKVSEREPGPSNDESLMRMH